MAGFDNRAGFAFGDIVMASHQTDGIQRPNVVVSSSTYNQQRRDILVMTVTILDRPNAGSGEIAIQNVAAAGLDPGAALMPTLMTIEQKLVRLILGRLDERDRQSLHHLLQLILGE